MYYYRDDVKSQFTGKIACTLMETEYRRLGVTLTLREDNNAIALADKPSHGTVLVIIGRESIITHPLEYLLHHIIATGMAVCNQNCLSGESHKQC